MHNFKLPRLYAIISFEKTGIFSVAEELIEYGQALMSGGVLIIQLRCKDNEDMKLLESVASELISYKYSKFSNCKIIINDFPEYVLKFGADGCHVGQNDTKVEIARSIIGIDKILGLSTNNIDHLSNIDTSLLNYLACGPVYRSVTKSGHADEIGLDGVKNMTSAIPSLPFVAIGGLNKDNSEAIYNAGAMSIAVVSDIKNAYLNGNLIQYIQSFETLNV